MSSSWHLSVRIRALAAATLLLAFVVGCGTSPVAPDPASGGGMGGTPAPAPSGPEVLVINPDGSVSYMRPPADSSASPAASLNQATILPSPDRAISQSVVMDGAVGGKMRCGRFVLLVPAGAFDSTGTVTMSMADSTIMIVDLSIAPAELNGFKLPVDLAITTTDVSVSPDSLQIYYYEPASKAWLALICDTALQNDPRLVEDPLTTTRGLLTPLQHFSTYSAGKAGW